MGRSDRRVRERGMRRRATRGTYGLRKRARLGTQLEKLKSPQRGHIRREQRLVEERSPIGA
jgi:hypothetical protein